MRRRDPLSRLRLTLARDTPEHAWRFIWRPDPRGWSPPFYLRRWPRWYDRVLPARWIRWEPVSIGDDCRIAYWWDPTERVPDGWAFGYTAEGSGWIRPLSWSRIDRMAYATAMGPSRPV
jgi:hypothetical protein